MRPDPRLTSLLPTKGYHFADGPYVECAAGLTFSTAIQPPYSLLKMGHPQSL